MGSVIYQGDSTPARDTSVHSIRSGHQVHLSILEKSPESTRNSVEVQYSVPFSNGRTDQKAELGFRGHVASLLLRFLWVLDEHLPLMEFAYNNSYQATIQMAPFEAQSRQKSYADVRRRDLEFEVGDHVFLKVAPMRGVLRFGKKGKLSPRFIGPFEILERVGAVAYKIALPPNLATVHNVFHVSMLQKYTPDPTHVIEH